MACFNKITLSVICVLFLLVTDSAWGQFLNSSPVSFQKAISKIEIQNNQTISSEAIENMMSLKVGSIPTSMAIAGDIKSIFASGYFQDVKINKIGDSELVVIVIEKPVVENIYYENFNIVSESSLKDKIVTKKYSILDEKKLAQDMRSIEQAYIEKGYYLAKGTYSLREVHPGAVDVIFRVIENAPITVRRVDFLGNIYFSNSELSNYMATRPYSWWSFLNSSGLFKDEFLAVDQQNITYVYRDNGYAEAVVASPTAYLDKSKKDIDVAFYIEPGERFHIGTVKIAGDLIGTEEEMTKKLSLKESDLYRISKFNADMKTLKTLYGDQGYAFAYVYPKFNIDRQKRTYDVLYQISKGEKVYFRNITVEGNVKTRDNVIRRALKVSEAQVFHATNLDKSKENVERLGFFETVDVLQEPDEANHAMDLKIKIKEKSTGSLNASLGASPNTTGSTGVTFFGALQYQEKNLIGLGYGVGANIQVSPAPDQTGRVNYTLGVNFSNPSIYDSPWSFGINGSYSFQVQNVTTTAAANQAYITQKITSAGVNFGREIIDKLRFTLGYSIAQYETTPTIPLTSKFYQSGNTEEISQALTYDATDSQMTPTDGFYLNGSNTFGVTLFNGQYKYGLLSGNTSYYLPIIFGDGFKTNFRFAFQPQYAYQLYSDSLVPYWKRLKLGNFYYMKGYSNPGETISPTTQVTISPVTGQTIPIITGGNRSFYGVVEYFVPLIPEAGLRLVTFAEAGTVLDDYDSFVWDNVKYDVGFGLRWKTPFAPFRFEWAFPIQNGGQLGEAHFVFTIGYDNFGSG